MSHTFTQLLVHVVFGTKNRANLIQARIKDELYSYMGGIVREMGSTALIINGMPDHAHLLVALPPALSVADLARTVKTNSSRWVHEKWPEESKFGWQQGYGAFSVSRSILDDVVRYIADQEKHHRKITFQEEFTLFLSKHGIEYDERYLWK
jgi:putative transposase